MMGTEVNQNSLTQVNHSHVGILSKLSSSGKRILNHAQYEYGSR